MTFFIYLICLFSGLTEIDDNDDVRKVEKTLEKQISELQATITRIQVHNFKSIFGLNQKFECLKLNLCKHEFINF